MVQLSAGICANHLACFNVCSRIGMYWHTELTFLVNSL